MEARGCLQGYAEFMASNLMSDTNTGLKGKEAILSGPVCATVMVVPTDEELMIALDTMHSLAP